MNQITIIGNCGEPELRFSNSGTAVLTVGVATNYGKDDKKVTTWHNVKVFGDMASHAAESIHKGTRVVVIGRFVSDKYKAKDGTDKESREILADEIAVSLRWAPTTGSAEEVF